MLPTNQQFPSGQVWRIYLSINTHHFVNADAFEEEKYELKCGKRKWQLKTSTLKLDYQMQNAYLDPINISKK